MLILSLVLRWASYIILSQGTNVAPQHEASFLISFHLYITVAKWDVNFRLLIFKAVMLWGSLAWMFLVHYLNHKTAPSDWPVMNNIKVTYSHAYILHMDSLGAQGSKELHLRARGVTKYPCLIPGRIKTCLYWEPIGRHTIGKKKIYTYGWS